MPICPEIEYLFVFSYFLVLHTNIKLVVQSYPWIPIIT